MKTNKRIQAICSIIALLAAGALLSGCGGGGASSSTAGVTAATGYSGPSGALSFSFQAPKKSSARAAATVREAGKVPSNTATITISVTSTVLDETETVVVAIDESGLGKATLTGIPAGLNYVELTAKDSSGAVVAHRVEAVMVIAGETTPVTATLGVSITASAFLPSNFTIEAGETVAWINNTSTPRTVDLSEDCESDLLKRGVLYCTLATPGTYTYSDPGGSSFTGTIIVEGEAPASLLAANPAADRTIGLAPLSVAFSGKAVSVGQTGSVTYSWDFDDGETSSQQNPTHDFAEPGFYEVSLIVSVGANSATEKINVVAQAPVETGALATLVISPGGATVSPGGAEEFAAMGFDANDNEVDVTVTWSVSGGIGTITQGGVFTATSAGSGAVIATAGDLTASANVTTLAAACNTDADCDDGNALTLDSCSNGGTSGAACSHTTIACNTGADCDDNNALTLDSCTAPGTAQASCANDPLSCAADADCADSNPLTLDTCSNPGTAQSSCAHAAIACITNAECGDGNPRTVDVCRDGGTLSAGCEHATIACIGDTDCYDANSFTIDVCSNPGTVQAVCSNTAIACSTDSDCADGNALTLDTCSNGGTATAACAHATIACNTNADCGDGNNYTLDACANGGTTSATCEHATMSCVSSADCNDSNVFTTDSCSGAGTSSALCSFAPIACTLNSECPDDGAPNTASECVNLVCAAVEISVMGTVTQNGAPVAGAVVRIYNDTYEDTTLTDVNGEYYFTGVPSGSYYLVATKQDATLESQTVTVP